MHCLKLEVLLRYRGKTSLSIMLFSCAFLIMFLLSGCEHQHISHDVKTTAKPWTHLNFHNAPEDFQFAILSDRTGGCRKGVFAKAVDKLNLIKPEFVICVGDLIQGYKNDTRALTGEWKEFNAIVKKLQMPFFYVSGNHDISNKGMYALWEKQFGSPYYSFIYKNVLFLCLNTQDEGEEKGRLSSAQVAWVKKTLAKHQKVRWTCVFMHQPLWFYHNADFNEIEKALETRDYTVFAGHFHKYIKCERKGKKYFILSKTGGGGKMRGILYGEFDEIMWVTMTDKGPAIANIQIDGILPENIMTIFQKNLKFKLCEDKSSRKRILFKLPLKNSFYHKMKYDLTWEKAKASWKTTPEKSVGFIRPGKEKILSFESIAKGGGDIPPVCKAKFYVKNELDLEIQLSAKKLVAHVKQPPIEVVFTSAKPEIDGILNDPVWSKAGKAATFFTTQGDNASVDTKAFLAYDKNNLYIAFKCFEPNIKGIKNTVRKHDGPIWNDDSIEVLIDVDKEIDRKVKSYYQIAVNPAAVVYDSFIDNGRQKRTYEIKPQVAARVNNDSWTVEMAIPWEKLNLAGVPQKDRIMKLLLVRTRKQKEGILQYPTLFGDNHQPEIFGDIKLK